MSGAAAAEAGSTRLFLRLYVAADSPNSSIARLNLKAYLEAHPAIQAVLETIDVLVEPERAMLDGVLVTPMLIVTSAGRERRIAGNLRNAEALEAAIPWQAAVG